MRKKHVHLGLALCAALAFAFGAAQKGNAQTVAASDDMEAYTGNNIEVQNNGTGWATDFEPRNFGGSDLGGSFLTSDSPPAITGQSGGIFAGDSGTGQAYARSLSTALTGPSRIEIKLRFNLNTGGTKTAGMIISDAATPGSNWNTGQQLFLGISGDGVWKYDDGTLKIVKAANGTDDFACIGGDLYEVQLDIDPSNDFYGFKIINSSASTESEVTTGTLNGGGIQTLGLGNGVTGSNQDLIFDDIVVTTNPSAFLPVALSAFTARPSAGHNLLQWSTATELNNSHFEIERSSDGRVWSAVGRVAGAGTVQEPRDYQFSDEAVQPGRTYYRLRQVDFDGQYEYHGPVQVVRSSAGTVKVRVFPNPAADWLEVAADGQQPFHALQLMDMSGRQVSYWPSARAGQRLSLEGVSPGVYQLLVLDAQGGLISQQTVHKQ